MAALSINKDQLAKGIMVLCRDESKWKDSSDHRNACNLFDNEERDYLNALLMLNIFYFSLFPNLQTQILAPKVFKSQNSETKYAKLSTCRM